jgi:hypothetical protein
MLALGIKANSPDIGLSGTTDWIVSTKGFQLFYGRLKALKARYKVVLGELQLLRGISSRWWRPSGRLAS